MNSVTERTTDLRGAVLGAPFLLRLFAVFIFGVGLSFIQAPYDLWFLLFPCLGGFYFFYLSVQTKVQAFSLGFVFAIGYFVTGLNWIGNALLVEGNEYRWVWPLAVIALPVALSLFNAIYITIAHILFKNKNTLTGFVGFCALLMLSEWVRGYAFTGFPWNLYGYGWISVPAIVQSVSLFGPYGLTFLTILWGCSLGYIFSIANKKIILMVFVLLSFGATYFYGHIKLQKASDDVMDGVRINIVQPNIKQSDKWKPELMVQNFEQLVALSTLSNPNMRNIIIWPETAVPPSFVNNRAVQERLLSLFDDVNTILLSGALNVTRNDTTQQPEYHNALMLFDGGNQPAQLYSKSHLVPFGEYIPFQQYIPLTPVVNFSGFRAGNGPQTIGVSDFPTFSPTICYEIIFPQSVVNKHHERPDFILTITNDGWYGDSPGPRQHFAQARFRAIEQGIPVVRVANTGISGVIDSYGRVAQGNKIELMEQGSLTLPLPVKTPQKTYYSMCGDKLFLGILFLCLFGAIAFRNKHNL